MESITFCRKFTLQLYWIYCFKGHPLIINPFLQVYKLYAGGRGLMPTVRFLKKNKNDHSNCSQIRIVHLWILGLICISANLATSVTFNYTHCAQRPWKMSYNSCQLQSVGIILSFCGRGAKVIIFNSEVGGGSKEKSIFGRLAKMVIKVDELPLFYIFEY